MAVVGNATDGDDLLAGDAANDEIIGAEGNDNITGGAGDDVIYGDIKYLANGGLDSNQADNSWSSGAVSGWTNDGSNGLLERWGYSFFGLKPTDGSTFIELDSRGGGIADHIKTNVDLETGLTYTITIDASARTGGSINDSFNITHNGVIVATIQPTYTGYFNRYEVTVTGQNGIDTIGLQELATQNNGLGILLDNVQISLDDAGVAASPFTYNDVIDAGEGNDKVYAGEGDDIITGGVGNDFLVGGQGADVFVYADGSGNDTIDDFKIGEDLLDTKNLTNAAGKRVAPEDVVVSSDGAGGSILTFPNGETIRLVNIPPSDVDTAEELNKIGIVCFCEGTHITTKSGQKPVEALKAGDMVQVHHQSDGAPRYAPLRAVLSTRVTYAEARANYKLRPIKISRHALGKRVPENDLYVSRQHRMVMSSKIAQRMFNQREALVAAVHLTALDGVEMVEPTGDVLYFHLIFDRHEIVFAEGAPSESFYPGKQAMKTLPKSAIEEFEALFPDYQIEEGLPYARVIPKARVQKHAIARHIQNQKPIYARIP